MGTKSKEFTYDDGIGFKDLFYEKINNIQTLIGYNDKNYTQRFDNILDSTKTALATADRAIQKSDIALEKRLDSVNEWRKTYEDLTRGYLTKAEFDAKWEGMEKNRKDSTSLVFAIMGMIISVVSLIIKFI